MLRIIAILLLCFIIVNLAVGLVAMLRDGGSSTKMVRALTWRVGLSLALFLLVVLAAAFDIFPN